DADLVRPRGLRLAVVERRGKELDLGPGRDEAGESVERHAGDRDGCDGEIHLAHAPFLERSVDSTGALLRVPTNAVTRTAARPPIVTSVPSATVTAFATISTGASPVRSSGITRPGASAATSSGVSSA